MASGKFADGNGCVADVLAVSPPSVGVDLLFTDGEDWGTDFSGPDALIGARYYASRLDSDQLPLYAVLFDMVGDVDLRIPKEGYSVQYAPDVVDRVWETARALGYGDAFVRRGGRPITDDHIPLIEAGVKAIDVIDIDYAAWHTPEDTPDKVSPRSLQIVGDVAVTLVK